MHLENISDDFEITLSYCGNKAIEILQTKNHEFDLIISDYNMEEGTGGDLYNYCKENCQSIPFILLSSRSVSELEEFKTFKEDNPLNIGLLKPIQFDDFQKEIQSLVEKTTGDASFNDSDFKKVRIIFFLRSNKSLCDIYIKLSDKNYVKLINKNDNYTREQLFKYTKKSVFFLYIKTADYDQFAVNFTSAPFLILDENLPVEKEEEAAMDSLMIMQDMVQSVGISPRTVQLANANINLIEKNLSNNKLNQLLQRQRNDKNFILEHSYLLTYFLCAVLKKIKWNTQEITNKLCYAALLHDLCTTHPEMATEESISDIEECGKFTDEQIEEYKNHPVRAAELVLSSQEIPMDVDKIIIQHHEDYDGSGFPNGVSSSAIPPLSATFIVIHNFVNELYKVDFAPEMVPQVVGVLESKYREGNFKEPMKALKHVFLDMQAELPSN